MALTATQKTQVRQYLGFPDLFRYKNTRLESALDAISAEAETVVTDTLTKLAAVDTQVSNMAIQLAGIKRADDVWFFQANSIRTELHALGRSYISRISIIFGIPPLSDYFGRAGYSGDSFFPGGRGSGSGSIPLG